MNGNVMSGGPLVLCDKSRLDIPTLGFSFTLPYFIHHPYITINTTLAYTLFLDIFNALKVPKWYKKCLWVSSSVKGKSLPTPPSGREWATS